MEAFTARRAEAGTNTQAAGSVRESPGQPGSFGVTAVRERVIADAAAAATIHLGHLSAIERERVRARVERSLDRVIAPIETLYPDHGVAELTQRLLDVAVAALGARSPDLRMLDARREVQTDWFQSPDRVGYVAYCEQFGPTIRDVMARLDHLASLGVTYFHLMKVIKPRPEPNDGGFAVADYRDVDPSLGTIDDLVALAAALRSRGISLCIDFVMNHTAAEHEWAMKAKAGDPHYRNYYLVYPDRTIPDKYEETLPEVFPEIAPGNFTWDAELSGWVWTTFNTYQWDLNYRNPDVLIELLDTMLALANYGVDVLRLDAVAFTWKRIGTNCQNQPEAHLIVQILRAFVEIAAPGVLLKAEAIVGPRELTAYLGAHARQRAECQLAYHNQLMVMIWSSLATRDAALLSNAMNQLTPTPSTAAWATYVRCHDDIGWAVDDADAAIIGVNAAMHRRYLVEFYRGDFPMSFARGAAFSVNEETGDERTCGMTAGLCGIDRARESGDRVALDAGVRRLLLAYAVAMSVGMPLIYMGDEVAQGNDLSYVDDPAKADDSRWMQRPVMDWDAVARAGVAGTVEERVFSGLRSMLATRATIPAMAQGGSMHVIDLHDRRLFALRRSHPEHGDVLVIANFSEGAVEMPAGVLGWVQMTGSSIDMLRDGALAARPNGTIRIEGTSAAWIVDPSASGVVPPLPL
jgi:amylosucrase